MSIHSRTWFKNSMRIAPTKSTGGRNTHSNASCTTSKRAYTVVHLLANIWVVGGLNFWRFDVVTISACSLLLPWDCNVLGLPIGWTSPKPGSVRDQLEVIYPWLKESVQERRDNLYHSMFLAWLLIKKRVFWSTDHMLHAWSIVFMIWQEPKHRVASLFSGVLGFELGLRPSGSQFEWISNR